ncbi:DUF3971 domain-containing protein [uncultured Litoreibacter sp.]|uniref:YhdP family protein n=1 Tax=uncultured Litoreibacter sp. TaxID=1392394 RepID=UPI0026151096|nr:DUF3971 domain-containing protein [uncultured Litoreibacter sp.]
MSNAPTEPPPELEGVDDAPPLPGGAPREAPRKRGMKVRKRWILLSVMTAMLSMVAAALVIGLLTVMGRSVNLPDWATEQVQDRINAQIEGPDILLAGVSVGLLDDELRPTVELQGIRMRSAAEAPLMALPSLQVKLDTSELLQGRIALETLDISAAQINLTRDASGQFAFAFGGTAAADELEANSVAEVMALIDTAFAHPALRELEEVTATGVRMVLDDQRVGRDLVVDEGRLKLVNGANFLALNVAFDISLDGNDPATLTLSADKAKGAPGGRLEAKFSQLRVRDVAEQVSTLNFLELLDAPIDGALTTEIGAEGEVVSFFGALNIGGGFVQPAPQAKPLPLNSARTLVRYSSATGRLHLEQLDIDAPELRLKGQGHADLMDFAAGIPETLLMQIRLSDLKLDPEGIFETPVTFSEGQVDLRYRPNDLKVDIGQMVLRDEGTEIVAGGKVSVGDAGWLASVDANIGSIDQDQLLGLWPTSAVKNTRDWLTSNIQSGELTNAAAALRVVPGKKLGSAVTFNFENANVRYLKTLPKVENGHGYVTIAEDEMTLVLHEGFVTAPAGGRLDVAGSVMQIPDINKKIPDAEISLRARGPLQAAMSLLDEKPFEFLSKSGFATDLAQGQADVIAQLQVPLAKEVLVKDVTYSVEALVRDVRSDTLVPGRSLRSEVMNLTAAEGALTIAGQGTLDGIPIDVTWERGIGPSSGDSSTVKGSIELSQTALNAFNIGLPDGSVRGKGRGQFELALTKGQVPDLTLRSNLRGVGLRIDALGWSKGPNQDGALSVALSMGETPVIKSLSISGAGLSATGSLTLRPGGGLDRAVFNPLKVAGRLNSRVEVVGRGKGRPVQLLVRGGSIDIRKFGVGSGGGAPTGGPPLDLALDSLQVTDDIRIDKFRGKFRNDRGLDGSFTGLVNGQAKINGVVVPTAKGLAVRIASANGGGVIAATGIFRNARGGEMNLVLQPTGRAGEFNGRVTVANTRIKKAPALADLLSALSVVGLLEQLSGDGILFSEVDATFTLSPGGVRLRESRAVGPSMGITMDGVYSTSSRKMQMQGVISPLFFVNRPLGFLFSKKGEGLFGFNYSLNGAADAPNVAVNPLSVFTPGIFREIFRQAPPKPTN